MAAQRHGARAGEAAGAEVDNPVVWLLLAPLGFYATWQLLYWLVVQVGGLAWGGGGGLKSLLCLSYRDSASRLCAAACD